MPRELIEGAALVPLPMSRWRGRLWRRALGDKGDEPSFLRAGGKLEMVLPT